MNLRDHLQRIYDERRELTPEAVEEAARPEDHPLHSHFEWDNNVAGHKYRLVQAAEMIRSVKVVYAENPAREPKEVRAFVAVPRNDSKRMVYRHVTEVLADDLQRRMLLADMEREWRMFERRYSHMAEFADLIRKAAS